MFNETYPYLASHKDFINKERYEQNHARRKQNLFVCLFNRMTHHMVHYGTLEDKRKKNNI